MKQEVFKKQCTKCGKLFVSLNQEQLKQWYESHYNSKSCSKKKDKLEVITPLLNRAKPKQVSAPTINNNPKLVLNSDVNKGFVSMGAKQDEN